MHRDIKPDNIIFSRDEFKPKIADLGFVTKIEHNKQVNRNIGTVGYMSPELFLNQDKI